MSSTHRPTDSMAPNQELRKQGTAARRSPLDDFGLTHSGRDPRPLRYPHTQRLFSTLINARIRGRAVYKALDASLRHVADSPIRGQFEHLDYLEPPEYESDPETRAVVTQRRDANPSYFKATIRTFDHYHHGLRAMWQVIADAKDCTDSAAPELDQAGGTPLDLPTVGICRALDRLQYAVRHPSLFGPYPGVNTSEHLAELANAIHEVREWAEKLRPMADQRISESASSTPHTAVAPTKTEPEPQSTKSPIRPVIVAEAAKVVNTRSDKMLDRLRRRDNDILGVRRRYMAELEDIKRCYPEHSRRLERWAEKRYPTESDPP